MARGVDCVRRGWRAEWLARVLCAFPRRSSRCCLVFKLLPTFLSLEGRSGSISCILCWMNFAFSAVEPLLTVLPWWKVTFWARECGMYCAQVVCWIQGHVSARKPTCLSAWGWGPSGRCSPKNQLVGGGGGWCWQGPWLWHSNWENKPGWVAFFHAAISESEGKLQLKLSRIKKNVVFKKLVKSLKNPRAKGAVLLSIGNIVALRRSPVMHWCCKPEIRVGGVMENSFTSGHWLGSKQG